MKIVLLLANSNYALLPRIKQIVTNVLMELEVEVTLIELEKLTFFSNTRTVEMDKIVENLRESNGVIAIASVPFIGIHGAMQSFFDHMSLYEEQEIESKPLMAITYSEWLGEVEAANTILKGWNILGGSIGGSICLNSQIKIDETHRVVERNIENFYRVVKQEVPCMPCSESIIYSQFKGKIISSSIKTEEVTTQEEDTYRIKQLFKQQIDEPIGEEFIDMNMAAYSKPMPGVMRAGTNKKLQSLPHYFIAKHDKELDLSVQYVLTDIKEKGYLLIKNGDCEYFEGIIDNPAVELSLTEETLKHIMSKQITYQKAFMIGKLKVKGNFILVAKLDQIFKPI